MRFIAQVPVSSPTDVFGSIAAPSPLEPFIQQGGSGAGGISQFLTSLIILIYSVASIVFVFMLLWGAWDLLTSGGDKQKVEGARKRLTYAFIGIVLFATAFAILGLVGEFTGFNDGIKFFKEQDPNPSGRI